METEMFVITRGVLCKHSNGERASPEILLHWRKAK